MSEERKHTILFVDDEEAILKALMRLFRKEGYHLLTAPGGEEALALLEKETSGVAVIVSDQKMPKMNGALFLEKAKQICPDAIRILLTGYSEMEALVAAVNKGEIHRYLTKPWNDDMLVMHVREAVDQYALIEENKRLMALTRRQNKQLFEFGRNMEKKIEERSRQIVEKNQALESLNRELESGLFNTIRAFAALTEMIHPHMKGHGKRVSALAVEIARKYDLSEEVLTQIEIAAILHDIGAVGFPPELIEKQSDNRCSAEEEELYRSHCVEGQSILSFISSLDAVGLLIRHHHEHYDGKGFPDKLFESEIPLGSRIIAVADRFDRLTMFPRRKRDRHLEEFLAEEHLTPDDLSDETLVQRAALHHIKQNAFTRYDPDVVKNLMDVLKDRGVNLAREKPVSFKGLKPGMQLSRSIYSINGRFILPHQTRLDEHIIMKLKRVFENGEIADTFFVVCE